MFAYVVTDVLGINKYIYANSNPIIYKDPNGRAAKKKRKAIIIYDKKDFKYEAPLEKEAYLTRKDTRQQLTKDDIYLVPISSAKQFKKCWNNECKTADYVTLILHSGPNAIGVGNDAVANNKYVAAKDIKKVIRIKNLKKINLVELRLYCCSAGHKDYKNNVARTFRKYNNIKQIYACDGGVSFSTRVKYVKDKYSYLYREVGYLEPRLSRNQSGFYSHAKNKKRKPSGFYYIYN